MRRVAKILFILERPPLKLENAADLNEAFLTKFNSLSKFPTHQVWKKLLALRASYGLSNFQILYFNEASQGFFLEKLNSEQKIYTF